MNHTKPEKWIEQAEARSVCELAKAEPGLFRQSATPSGAYGTAIEMRKIGLLDLLCHPVEHMRAAA